MSGANNDDRLKVFVRGLKLEAEIGLYPHEQGRAQPLRVDILVELEPVRVGRIGETLDYDRLAETARRLGTGGHIDLVETFAQRLAAACLEHPRARSCTVHVEKPEAVPDADVAGVEVTLVKAAADG